MTKSAHNFRPTNVDQIGMVVTDIKKVMETWTKMLGVGPWEVREVDARDDKIYPRRVILAKANIGPTQIELIQPIEGVTPPASWHTAHGDGIHHLAFTVDDFDGEIDALVAKGATLLIKYPDRFALLDIGPGGVVVELVSAKYLAGQKKK